MYRRKCFQNAGIFYRPHICPVWWTPLSTNGRHSNGNWLCSYTRRPTPSLLCDWLYSWSNPSEGASFSLILWSQFPLYKLCSIVKKSHFQGIHTSHLLPKNSRWRKLQILRMKSAAYLDLHLEFDEKENYRQTLRQTWWLFIPYCQLSFLSAHVARSLQQLRMEFSNHNPYVMPELTVTMQTFCTALHFL